MVRRMVVLCTLAGALAAGVTSCSKTVPDTQASAPTATPIRHLVILFSENVSFDHYFATYPTAANPPGEPAFVAAPGTPRPDNLVSARLLTNNPNFTNPGNGADAAEPFRLDRAQANTADQNHLYTAVQQAYNGGKADLFPKYAGTGTPGGAGAFGTRGQVMGYFDGNTVTALWNYAQHFALNDNAFTDAYGPSTPGMLEVVAGQTNGMTLVRTSRKPSTLAAVSYYIEDGQGGYTMINDVDPAGDPCSSRRDQVLMTGRNIGDLLNEAGISWGGFMGGFDLSATNANGSTGCARRTRSPVIGQDITDYIPHHAWFQYFASTANPAHARPAAVAAIGHSFAADGQTRDPANHQYDLEDFYTAVTAGNFPAVSYIKASAYQDGHAGYSDPLDEQEGIVRLANFLQRRPEWKDTALIVTWDDSDGWYDHAYAQPIHASADPQADQLNGAGRCGSGAAPEGVVGKPVNGRCGPGTRVPFLVISPWAKPNAIDHTRITQASVIRFIEDNWLNGKRLGGGSFDAGSGSLLGLFDFAQGGTLPPLILDPASGTPMPAVPAN